jgi:hypothetical protein
MEAVMEMRRTMIARGARMKTRGRIILWVVLVLGAFLLGFVPEYLKNRELRSQVQDGQKTLDGMQLQVQLGQLRDGAYLMAFEASRQNFGLARDHATQFYNKLTETINSVQDPVLKKSLEELAATRDATMQELAAPTPASLALLQSVVLKTVDATRSAK